jgi:hypothetical protein
VFNTYSTKGIVSWNRMGAGVRSSPVDRPGVSIRSKAERLRVSKNMMIAAIIAVASTASSANSYGLSDPLRFFVGTTESVTTVNVLMRKAYSARARGYGEIGRDGSLSLVQRVEDEGKKPFERRWYIRRAGPGRFEGSMSQAKGPVAVAEIDGRYRFRFRVKGNLSVEQWFIPLPGGTVARTESTVRKLGLKVATSRGFIRRIS